MNPNILYVNILTRKSHLINVMRYDVLPDRIME